MMWSKLKQTVEGRFADSLTGRVELHSTYYRHGGWDNLGRDWITVDKSEIANLCGYQFLNEQWEIVQAIRAGHIAPDERAGKWRSDYQQAEAIMHGRGALPRWDFHDALWDSLSLSIDDMLRSENGIVRGLAVLDGRLGKRRLRALVLPEDELPLVRTLYALRCEAEGIAPATTGEQQPTEQALEGRVTQRVNTATRGVGCMCSHVGGRYGDVSTQIEMLPNDTKQ